MCRLQFTNPCQTRARLIVQFILFANKALLQSLLSLASPAVTPDSYRWTESVVDPLLSPEYDDPNPLFTSAPINLPVPFGATLSTRSVTLFDTRIRNQIARFNSLLPTITVNSRMADHII